MHKARIRRRRRSARPLPDLQAPRATGFDPQAPRLLERVVQSGAPEECQIEVAGKNGTLRCFRLSVSPAKVVGADNRIDGLLEDVTQRIQTEAEIRESEVAAAKIDMLSPREKQVLNEVVKGNANKVIARNLNISDKTVEKHRSSLMKKLRVKSVAELVRMTMLGEIVGRQLNALASKKPSPA